MDNNKTAFIAIKEQERIQCQFATFCKVVLRNTSCNYFRDLSRKRKIKSKLVPYEVIEKAVDGDTASLLVIQQHFKPFIRYLSNGDIDLLEILNSKLLEAVLKFKPDYHQPPSE